MRQKITSAVALWLLLTATSIQAADMPDQYTLYCKGEQANGFNWLSNNWEKRSFKPSDYIIVKSQNNNCFLYKINREVVKNSAVMHTKDVCINIREAGEEYRPGESGKCTEYYSDSSDTKWSDYLSCENIFQKNFVTKFNGWFHRSLVHSDLNNRSDYKDSLVIEVGKCSQIN